MRSKTGMPRPNVRPRAKPTLDLAKYQNTKIVQKYNHVTSYLRVVGAIAPGSLVELLIDPVD